MTLRIFELNDVLMCSRYFGGLCSDALREEPSKERERLVEMGQNGNDSKYILVHFGLQLVSCECYCRVLYRSQTHGLNVQSLNGLHKDVLTHVSPIRLIRFAFDESTCVFKISSICCVYFV